MLAAIFNDCIRYCVDYMKQNILSVQNSAAFLGTNEYIDVFGDGCIFQV